MPFYGRDLVPFRTHANHSADWFEANEVMGPKGLLEMPQKNGLTIYLPLPIRPVSFDILHHRSPVIIRHIAPKSLIQFFYRYLLPLHSQKLRIRCADKGHKR